MTKIKLLLFFVISRNSANINNTYITKWISNKISLTGYNYILVLIPVFGIKKGKSLDSRESEKKGKVSTRDRPEKKKFWVLISIEFDIIFDIGINTV